MDELPLIALGALFVAVACAFIIMVDLLTGNKQKMWIMNIVWPVSALYLGPFGLLAYFTIGRKNSAKHTRQSHMGHKKPFWQSAFVATLHCGSGCTLGNIIAELLISIVPVFVWGSNILGAWVVDFVFAFLLGIIFQYYTIKPMKKLSAKQGLIAALKVDTLSLIFWQIGMYGWMAIATFIIFNHDLRKDALVFCFMMQIAMLFGLLTSYGINWWLLKKGIKEVM